MAIEFGEIPEICRLSRQYGNVSFTSHAAKYMIIYLLNLVLNYKIPYFPFPFFALFACLNSLFEELGDFFQTQMRIHALK